MSSPGALRQAFSGPRNWPVLLLRTGLTIAVLVALVHFVSVDALTSAMRKAPPLLWLGVLAGLFTGHVFAAMKWRMFLRASGADCADQSRP